MLTKPKPILITGSHRSGSTWVGRTLAASHKFAYIQEPFNIRHDNGLCGAQFKYWFTYICADNEQYYKSHFLKTFDLQYSLFRRLIQVKNPRRLPDSLRRNRSFAQHRRRGSRPLLKDPIAIFSAEWLAKNFETQVVVVVRHPAAFAGSLKVKSWAHPFDHFLNQPLLLRDHLSDFTEEITEHAQKDHDIVEQASLLWRIIYSVVLKYQEDHKDWIFVRHEDISRDPEPGFKDLCQRLDIPYTSDVENFVRTHTQSDKAGSPVSNNNRGITRNSMDNINSWKVRLEKGEIDRIHVQTADLASAFYGPEDW